MKPPPRSPLADAAAPESADAPSPRARAGHGLAGPLLALTGVALALALIEATYPRLSLAKRRSYYERVRVVWQASPTRVAPDPDLGFLSRPGLDVVFANPATGGFATRVRTNSRGLRDDEASLDDPAVFVLGDSFAFGWGVEGDETVAARLEAATGRRVLNLGQSGYGPIQALLLFRRLAGGRDLAGRDVVWLVYGNDLVDIGGHGFGVYPRLHDRPIDGAPVFTRAAPGAFGAWQAAMAAGAYDRPLYRKSFAAYLLGRLGDKAGRVTGLVRRPAPTVPPRDAAQRTRDFGVVAGLMAAEVKARRGALSAVYIPPVTRFTDGAPSGFEAVRPALYGAGMRVLDATPLLRAGDYYPLDGHWRASGHEKVARRVAAWWQEN